MAKKSAAPKGKTPRPPRKGVVSPGVTTAPMNREKTYQAKRMQRVALSGSAVAGGGAGEKTAGMMLTNLPLTSGSYFNSKALGAYYTSYANGMQWGGGTRDIPPYFVQMNEQNGGVLYWPVTLREKYEFYRYFARTDAYCGRALDLLTDLPMSKIVLTMPKMEGQSKELKQEIQSFFEGMVDKLELFDKLQNILYEWNVIGNVFIFHEWNDKQKSWDNIQILPPEEVAVFHMPFSNRCRIEYRPERMIQIIAELAEAPDADVENPIISEIFKNIPKEIVNMVKKEGCIVMDNDPNSGSFCTHLARRKTSYMDLGASILERVFVPLLQKEHFRYTQLGLASRNMTPKNKISAPSLNPDELADLRAQVDLSYLDPEFSIVTNYEWDWQQMGAEGRLLDLTSENESIENQIFAGLGVTRELLTGEGVYSGTKITVEILNTMFLITREILQNYVERQLFRPVCEAHGWFDEDKHGFKKYWYPKLGFNRLSIRDNQEVFDSLFQLYQKGSLPVDIIYELFNLNSDEIHDKIYSDLFTVKDPVFNRVVEEASQAAGIALAEKTDIVKRLAKYLRLNATDENGQPIAVSDKVITPMEQYQMARAEKMEHLLLKDLPEMGQLLPKDIEDISDKIVQHVDLEKLDPAALTKTISETVDEVLQ